MFAGNAPFAEKALNESQNLEQDGRPIGSAKSNHSVPGTPTVASSKPIAITLK